MAKIRAKILLLEDASRQVAGLNPVSTTFPESGVQWITACIGSCSPLKWELDAESFVSNVDAPRSQIRIKSKNAPLSSIPQKCDLRLLESSAPGVVHADT